MHTRDSRHLPVELLYVTRSEQCEMDVVRARLDSLHHRCQPFDLPHVRRGAMVANLRPIFASCVFSDTSGASTTGDRAAYFSPRNAVETQNSSHGRCKRGRCMTAWLRIFHW